MLFTYTVYIPKYYSVSLNVHLTGINSIGQTRYERLNKKLLFERDQSIIEKRQFSVYKLRFTYLLHRNLMQKTTC